MIINWFNTPINDRRRKRLFVLSLLEDIMERNQAQEALRKTNQTYQALILGAPLAIIILDTGVGMTKSQVNNLFELFAQDSDGYQRKFKALGLG